MCIRVGAFERTIKLHYHDVCAENKGRSAHSNYCLHDRAMRASRIKPNTKSNSAPSSFPYFLHPGASRSRNLHYCQSHVTLPCRTLYLLPISCTRKKIFDTSPLNNMIPLTSSLTRVPINCSSCLVLPTTRLQWQQGRSIPCMLFLYLYMVQYKPNQLYTTQVS